MRTFIKSILFIAALSMAFTSVGQGRKIVGGFFPDWVSASQVNTVQYNKLTDVFFAFLAPDGNGNLSTTTAGSGSTILSPLSTKCKQNNVKIHASIGGANHSYNFGTIVGSNAAMDNFVNSTATFIQTYNLDGINVDWEFPAANHATGLATLMQKLRTRMDQMEGSLGRQLELSIAVGPLLWNTDGINATTISLSDYVLVMSFDASGGCCVCDVNHSGYNIAVRSLQKWGTSAGLSTNCGGTATGKNTPASKIVLSIPIYDNSRAEYKNFSASNPSGFYNDADGNFNGYYYNSKPLIDQKVQHMMTTYPGAAGVWCWELTNDRTDQYSLLGAMWNAMQPYMGPACNVPQPNLGADQSICGQSSITLQSGVATASGRTFEWTRNGTTISGATGVSYTATTSGTYKVIVREGSTCSKEDEMIISATAPTVSLGADQTLCTTSSITLDAGVSGSGYTYSWTRNSTSINGANAKTLSVTEGGTYAVTVSVTGCGSSTDAVIVTSNLVSAQGASRCGSGQVTLQVTSSGTSFSWFTASTGGSSVATGTSYSPNVTATTTFYVESGSGGSSSPECNTAQTWLSTTEFNRQSGDQVISVKYNGFLYTLASGVWWSLNNQPDLFPNIWTKGSSCTGTSCVRTPVVATVSTGCAVNPTITYSNVTKTYGDASFNMTATSNSAGAITYSIVSGTAATVNASGQVSIVGAGTVVLRASQAANGNYNAGTQDATLTINKKSLTATADNKTKSFGAANPALTITYSGFVNGESASVLDVAPSISTTATTNSAAGTYPITLSGGSDNNYTLTLVNGTLTVTRLAPTITYSNVTKTYGDASFNMTATSNSAGTITYSIVSGTAATVNASGQVSIVGAGTVVLRASQAANGNYNAGTQDATLTINKKSLTATADNKTKSFGAANPALTITYVGFVNGESASVLDVAPSISTTATTNSAAGTYAITLSGGSDNNYTLTLVNGTLTVQQPVNTPPTASITSPSNNFTVMKGVSVTLTSTSSDQDGSIVKVEYRITAPNNQVTTILGNASIPHNATWVSSMLGVHSVVVVATDDKGATFTAQPISITVDVNTSVSDDLKSKVEVRVYPNPVRDQLSIEVSQFNESVVSVEVYDLIGNKILVQQTEKPAGNNTINLDMSDKPAGFYLVKVKSTSLEEVVRITKN